MYALKDVRVRSVSRNEKRQEVLLEMTLLEEADWVQVDGRIASIESVLGTKLRHRNYQVIVKFVPIDFNLELEKIRMVYKNGIDTF